MATLTRFPAAAPSLLVLGLLFAAVDVNGTRPGVTTASALGTEIVLYDGSLGTLPADQGMAYQAADTTGPSYTVEVVQSYSGDGARLDSTADYEDHAGYTPDYASTFPTLDRQHGVTIRFTMQLTSEDHTASGTAEKNGDGVADRAGFSVIAISSDGQRGIELGFWENEIWAQEGGVADLFTHAEGVTLTTGNLTTYELVLQGERYALSTGDSVILDGPLRDYTAFIGLIDPYETPNFLFFGDDTSSASADVKLTAIVVGEEAIAGPYRTLLPLVRGQQ